MFGSAVEVLWTARYDYEPDWKLLPHQHDHFQMICFLSGSGVFTLGQRPYAVSDGTLFLIKPDCPHGLRPTSVVKTLDIKFLVKDRELYGFLMDAGDKVEDTGAKVANLFEQIRCEGESAGHLHREMCNLHLTQILIRFLRLQAEQPAGDFAEDLEHDWIGEPVTRRALAFIKEHYAEDIDLRGISVAAGKSDRYIRRQFEELLGTSPMRYLQRYRIYKAKELIRESEFALKQVAELVGFKSIHHFARAFHEICGETPGAWRRKYHAGICKDVCIHPHFSNTSWTVTEQPLTAHII